MKKIKLKNLTDEMIKKGVNGEIDFQVKHKDLTYNFTSGMISKTVGTKVYLFDGKSFKFCEELSL